MTKTEISIEIRFSKYKSRSCRGTGFFMHEVCQESNPPPIVKPAAIPFAAGI